jgi:hypothetical protein
MRWARGVGNIGLGDVTIFSIIGCSLSMYLAHAIRIVHKFLDNL